MIIVGFIPYNSLSYKPNLYLITEEQKQKQKTMANQLRNYFLLINILIIGLKAEFYEDYEPTGKIL